MGSDLVLEDKEVARFTRAAESLLAAHPEDAPHARARPWSDPHLSPN